MHTPRKPKLAVWKFASCDGCQLSLLDCEDELLPVVNTVSIAYFPEATRAEVEGPYDISLVEGSISTGEDAERIQMIRDQSNLVITIGACATSGGIQGLRNFANVDDYINTVYAHPEYIHTLRNVSPISQHVFVDYEVRGCPVNKYHLLEVLTAHLAGRRPNIPSYSVCVECKRRGTPCVMVSDGTPCMGPVTQAGCGAICPAYNRGCYGCYGPSEDPNPQALSAWWKELGVEDADIARSYRSYNALSGVFRREGSRYAKKVAAGVTNEEQRQ